MTIVCPYQDCQQQIEAEAQHAGTEASCPVCKRPMQLPEIAAFPVEESTPAPWASDDTGPQKTKAQTQTAAKPQQASALSNDTARQSASASSTALSSDPATRPDRSALQQTSRIETAPGPVLSPEPDQGAFSSGEEEEGLTPGGAAGCPKCLRAFDEDVQQFVQELVELRELGSDVSKLGVTCPCGAHSKFNDLSWIKNTATSEPAFRKSSKKASFHPPNSSRDRAKIMSDAGFVAVKSGDLETAHAKWLQATEADQSWSVPFFNLARLSLDRGDRHAASAFLGLAEDRAQRGSSNDDGQVMKQVSMLKARLDAPAVPE